MERIQLPFRDLRELSARDLPRELVAGVAVTVMGVPQGIAYALIAGLPPAMGLYAAAVPAVVGALFRSSRLVVIGPTNALSLIVATSVAATMPDPVAAATTLALMVGALQIAAGILRLSALVDYISTAVVTGYITGAASLIVVGQLPNVTGTTSSTGDLFHRVAGWAISLSEAHLGSCVMAVTTATGILVLRRWLPRGVPALVLLGVATGATWAFGLDGRGIRIVSGIAPVPNGLPPWTIPSLAGALPLGSVAVAAMVLSLVESTSLSRVMAERSDRPFDAATDFIGLGLANLAAAFTGGYPVSGSPVRSGLVAALGARSRLASASSGIFVGVVLVGLGTLVGWTPIPALAGLILVVARDVVDPGAIRALLHAGPADRYAFLGTVCGTWLLPLDQAIYVGVGISVVLFLRRARLLTIRELWVDEGVQLHEVDPESPPAPALVRCRAIRVLHVEGPLFFGAASELAAALGARIADPGVRVLLVRLKRAQGIDYTAGTVLARAHERMARDGRHLMLVGLREDMMVRLHDIGVAEVFESEELFPTRPGWFVAMDQALGRALELVGAEHGCGAGCPVERYLEVREARGA